MPRWVASTTSTATATSSASARRSRRTRNAEAGSERPSGVRAATLAALAVLFLWIPSVYPTFVSPNELSRILLTRAIVEDGTFAIDRGVARQGEEWSDLAKFAGHYYSDKAPGLSFLAVPVALALQPLGAAEWSDVRLLYWCRLFTVSLPILGFLMLRIRAARSRAEADVWIALGVGSLLYTQALSFTAHLPAALLLLLVFEGVRSAEASSTNEALLGALAASAVALDYLAALPLAVLFVFALTRRVDSRVWRARAAGFALPLAGLLAYHWACFGGPFELAYSHMVVAAHQANRARGFFGAAMPDPGVAWRLLFGGERGLFVHSPLLLGALAAAALAWRDRLSRAEAAAVFSLFGLVLVFVAALGDWQGGWGVGPRYLTLAVPFLAWALARWHTLLPPRLGGLAAVAAGWGATLHVLAVATFPLAPFGGALRFPALELAAFLARRGLVAWNPAFLAGVHGLASLLPLGAAAAFLVFVRLDARRGRRTTAFLAGAALLLALAATLARSRGEAGERELSTFPARAGYRAESPRRPPVTGAPRAIE